MQTDRIAMMWGEASYPSKSDYFDENNGVFSLIKNGLYRLGLDRENYGSDLWNPFSKIINLGDSVLVKPNMVLHKNRGDGGSECLYTHPSVVVPIVHYLVKALKGTGRIIIGDAPLQECDFDVLTEDSGYKLIVDYYSLQGIDISLVDFRNVKTYVKDGVHYLQEDKRDNGVIVQLNEKSAFNEFSEEDIRRFRVTNYAPSIMEAHHKKNKHEYMISKCLLESDVVINMPKPKTHRKAGITGALKNMVGINANKEFLPHHSKGGSDDGGDEYDGKNEWHDIASALLDIVNELNLKKEYAIEKNVYELYLKCFDKAYHESYTGYSEGSWYGNDTIWRTIQDLNYILLYADKNGIIRDEKQRNIFIVGDMIISGEKEGPLEPSPMPLGLICMGDNPIIFDKSVADIMGFDWKKIPSIYRIKLQGISSKYTKEIIVTNQKKNTRKFEPSIGWIEALGSPNNDKVIAKCKATTHKIYIFGACPTGCRCADALLYNGINVESIIDNDPLKVKKWGYKGIDVVFPYEVEKDGLVLLAIPERYMNEVVNQLKDLGITNIDVMR